ncbi:MAG: hypothetical protein R6U56_05000, partial [Opitutales bacterium]
MQALSISMPNFETWGRASPLIITAQAKDEVRYEIIDDYSFYTYRTYKIISSEKDILSDYNIPRDGLIEIE